MTLHWRLRSAWSYAVPLARHAVLANLTAALDQGVLRGSLDGDRFLITYVDPGGGRNSWRPRLAGTLVEEGAQTRVDVVAAVHPIVYGFTLLVSCLVPGVAWIMGTFAFSAALPGMRAAVEAVSRGR